MTRATIDLHIETLVLEGLPAVDGAAIRAAVELELSRLVADGGFPGMTADAQGSRNFERIDGGSFAVRPGIGSRGAASGAARQVASAVYRGIGR